MWGRDWVEALLLKLGTMQGIVEEEGRSKRWRRRSWCGGVVKRPTR